MRAANHGSALVCLGLGLALPLACGGSGSPPENATGATEPSMAAAGQAPEAGNPPPESTGAEPSAEPAAASDEPTPAPGTDSHRHPDETRTTAGIAGIIKEHREKARACYEEAAKDIPHLAGDVVIQFVLGPEGKVQEASLNQERSNITAPSLVNCLIDVIRSLPFPASSRGMETKVNYPFNFKP